MAGLVKDIMTTDLFTLMDTDSLRDARAAMNLARIRHIPIVDAAFAFIGLVTHRDILKATVSCFAEVDNHTQDELDQGIPIRFIMRTDVACVSGDTPLAKAALILLEHKYGCLPVIEDGRLVGIITEADFLKLVAGLLGDNPTFR